MSRRSVVVGSRPFVVSLDDPPAVAEQWWALAIGRLVDEGTGEPAAALTTGSVPRAGVSVKSSGDGTFALVARPWLACPPLLAPSYSFTATLETEGYLPVELAVDVPSRQRQIANPAPPPGSAGMTLSSIADLTPGQRLAIGPSAMEERGVIRHLGPGALEVTLDGGLYQGRNLGDPVVADAWFPIDLGVVGLRRPPVVLRGRTVRRDPATNSVAPVANATVALIDFWTALGDLRAQLPGAMNDPNPATRAFMVSLTPGLVAPRDVGPGVIARQVLTPAINDDRFLATAVAAGTSTFPISNRQGILAGSLLRLDVDQPVGSETVEVASVTGFGPPDQAGDVSITLPLRASHRAGARVVPLTAAPPQPAVALRRSAQPGDRTLFVASLSSLPDGADGLLTGGAAAGERQHIYRIETTSDAGGYFALPPVHRVAALRLRATALGLSPVTFDVHPEYAGPEQVLDVAFT
jgi:hypothetical protein